MQYLNLLKVSAVLQNFIPLNMRKLNRLFIKEYKINNPIHLSPEVLRAYFVYKLWKVLHKVKEWIRRLKWMIETDIFNFSLMK